MEVQPIEDIGSQSTSDGPIGLSAEIQSMSVNEGTTKPKGAKYHDPDPHPDTYNPSLDGECGISDDEDNVPPISAGPSKKKKKKLPKSQRGMDKPTGFEENYADVPLTQAEHQEETKELYHTSRSFRERIEICIQRYRGRRKFHSEKADIFNSYLTLGGVENGPRMFSGGLDMGSLSELDAEQIADITAIDSTDRIKNEPEAWVVDWEGVVSGFLSETAYGRWDLSIPGKYLEITSVVRNFLNYVLYHDVCPEYKTEVEAARAICDLAETEHAKISKVIRLSPGKFNLACSALYGGHYENIFDWHGTWKSDHTGEIGMDPDVAEKHFNAGVAAYGTDEQFVATQDKRIKYTERREIYFEVTEIIPPSQEARDFYNQLTDDFQPLGKIVGRAWRPPYLQPEDLTAEEKADLAKKKVEQFEFYMEEDVLEHCSTGMKIGASMASLDCGIHWIDCVSACYPSFYTYLPSERMSGWREPAPKVRDDDKGLSAEIAAKDWKDREEGTMHDDLDCEGKEYEF